MPKVTRRDILATFASAVLLAGHRASAAVCDVRRSRSEGISTKSYSCQLGEGRALTATFMRISDVLADSAGRDALPTELGGFEKMASGNQLVENETLKTFQDLMERFSQAYSKPIIYADFDGRSEETQGQTTAFIDTPMRFRTLGYWDETDSYFQPFFPLPDLLRKAILEANRRSETDSLHFAYNDFLRFAQTDDFQNLDEKVEQYLSLWRTGTGQTVDKQFMGNLDLLRHVQAGTVQNFLPLFFSTFFMEGCSGDPRGGASYAPPALFVDIAVCRNDGAAPVRIEDFFGAADARTELRAYDPATPPEARRFGWRPVTLQPGESVIATQRLLFSAQPSLDLIGGRGGDKIRSQRAVFGKTELPKGVIVDGQDFPFDGRSHNTLIVASAAGGHCCPHLYSWCDVRMEWVMRAKVLIDNSSRDAAGTEVVEFSGLHTHFKFVEREHERTYLAGVSLELELEDGQRLELTTTDTEAILDIGQSHEVVFALPPHVIPSSVRRSHLKAVGYYEKYSERHVAERREALRALAWSRPLA